MSAAAAKSAEDISALYLVYSEINAVTSAVRKHARNAASASFLGSATSSAGGILGPVAGGSSSASLLKGSVAAASLLSGHAGPSSHPNGSTNTSGHVRNASLDNVVSPNVSANGTKPTRLAYHYADSRREDSINGLLSAFTALRAQLHETGSVQAIPQPLLLLPFLRVILSPRTTGPVTSIALQAVYRLLVNDVITSPSVELDVEIIASRQDGRDTVASLHKSSSQLAIAEIAHAVSHCQFEASDAVADELVLLRILAVMRELICYEGVAGTAAKSKQARRPLADFLSDESVCEMMETGLSMCCQMRLSDLLRKTAEQSVTTMVRALFAKLNTMPLTADEAYSADPDVPQAEPEHATLAAEPVGEDAIDAENKRLRRITMPDPTSLDVPAAGIITPSILQELKALGESEETEIETDAEKAGKDDQGLEGGASSKLEEDEVTVQTPLLSEAAAEEDLVEVKPQQYGLPAIKEVLRVIISLLDPQNQQHTDAMRLLGMSMLTAVFEVSGDAIDEFPSLRALIQDSACKHLFALVKSENPNLDGPCLRTMSTLFQIMHGHLKLQYELFLSHLLERLAPLVPTSMEPWNEDSALTKRPHLKDSKARADTPDSVREGSAPPPSQTLSNSPERSVAQGEARELYLETLGLLLGLPFSTDASGDRFVELWINYDCDVDCENMLEQTVKSLCRNVYAANPLHSHVQDGSQIFSLDALLKMVGNMASRYEGPGASQNTSPRWPNDLPSLEALADHKRTKASILAGAAKFNEKPKDGLRYFEEVGFIRPRSEVGEAEYNLGIAQFLKSCSGLDKKLLGDFLSRPNNEGILEAFLGLFDFRNNPVAEAMREMLEAFRLPGESQQIARITETFAKIYFAGEPEGIKNEDAVYVLSYSIIMLNTDLHNPQNKRRMTNEDYRRNLRGVNDGQNFEPEFLDAIYDSIRRREIVMPEEHKGQLGFEYTWKELLRRSRKSGDLHCVNTSYFDQTIFATCWRPIVASIAYAFSTFRDEHLLERAITGFRQCAMLASRFGMNEIFDYLVNSLAGATGLLDANGSGHVTNNAVVDFDGQRISVSPLSIQFGRNFKGQLAAVVLFTIANGNGHAIRTGWLPIFEICKNLFINSLLANDLTTMFEFGDEPGPNPLPIKAKRAPGPPPQDPRSQSGAGIFSTISSYLLSPYTSEKELTRPDVAVNEEAVELTLCTIDCVSSCRIDGLFAILPQLNDDSREGALQALRQLADRYTVERRAALVSEGGQASGNDSSGRSTPVQGSSAVHSVTLRPNQPLPYDAGGAFVLEAACNLASSSPETVDPSLLWSLVAGHAVTIISAPGHYHSTQVERAVVAVFRMIRYACTSSKLREEMFLALDQINGLPVEYRTTIATQVTAGIETALRSNRAFATSKTEWSIVLTMLAVYGNARSAKAVQYAMSAVQNLIDIDRSGTKEYGVTFDNFAGIIALLRDYARAADALRFDGSQAGLDFPQARKTLTEKKALKEYEEACQSRGPQAVIAIEQIRLHVSRLAELGHLTSLSQAWSVFWIPLMSAIAVQYTNPHRATRQAALTHLQRALLATELLGLPGIPSSPQEEFELAHALFNSIVFPTLHELLKPETFQIDPSDESGGMQETRIRSCNLLCKVYLHYLNQLTGSGLDGQQGDEANQRYQQLWLVVLDFFDRFMHSGKRDQLSEATPENLKNVLLVMNAAGVLVAPSSADRSQDIRTSHEAALFDQTFERIQRFLPRLKDEIFPALNPVEVVASDQRRASEHVGQAAVVEVANPGADHSVAQSTEASEAPVASEPIESAQKDEGSVL